MTKMPWSSSQCLGYCVALIAVVVEGGGADVVPVVAKVEVQVEMVVALG